MCTSAQPMSFVRLCLQAFSAPVARRVHIQYNTMPCLPPSLKCLQAASFFRSGQRAAQHCYELHYNAALLAQRQGDLQTGWAQVGGWACWGLLACSCTLACVSHRLLCGEHAGVGQVLLGWRALG